ncbi:MAG: dehydrogenase E1 component subunit alpha/beta [Flavobacteriales bacterium]|nr:dehydrogenase E1 component subunit alpha/beta [Flavobacteriales bacterium]MCX7769054.1 dehydrogenase E1 component subunit alpha/beta [Flavobacteriales bacterium]MDW8410329.1 dehydrogenase E1 component subunit alpha/beta [Flavobacteriales bacterium]
MRHIYRQLILPRLIEEKMLILLRQGRISKWFSGIGQEAISVGCALGMEDDEYLLPMHRNLGMFTARGIPLKKLFLQFQGRREGFTKGRDRSFHFGTHEYRIVGMISHLGPQMAVADGIALASKLRGEGKATLVITGDGATSEGDVHEAFNVASVWDLPVLFVIENNGYGLSTPNREQFRCEFLTDRAPGYAMESVILDGNNILEVIHAIRTIARSVRKRPRPVMIECITFRMRGHEEASGTKYVPQELFERWEKKDPIRTYENFLLNAGIITSDFAEATKKELKDYINREIEEGLQVPPLTPDTEEELRDVYAPFIFKETPPKGLSRTGIRFLDAIREGLDEAMQRHSNLILMGQDIAEYGGVFKVTEGFVEKYGKERVRNTPLCESAILGCALGLSIKGMKAMVEMQFADFVTCGFNQIVNNLAKIHYRWGQNADVVIRMPTGAGVNAGPFHSQSNEAWFFHVPGLKIVYPAFPDDAKGLLLAAFEDPNPVMFFEHKALYRSITGSVPAGYYTVPIGQAKWVRRGSQATIITYGAGVHWALEIVEKNEFRRVGILDLRTLLPFDKEAILKAVRQTNRILILHEDTLIGGIGAELAAFIQEEAFSYLDAPIMRCAALDTPVPFAHELEWNFLPKNRLEERLRELLSF